MNETWKIQENTSLNWTSETNGFNYRFWISLLLSFGIISSNIIIIVVANSKTKVFQSKIAGRLITALAGVDFVIGLFFATSLPNILLQRWVYDDTVCLMQAAISAGLLTSVLLIIAMISLERYIAICRPLYYHQILTRQRYTVVIVLALALVCLMVIIPPLAGVPGKLHEGLFFCVLDYERTSDKLLAFVYVGGSFVVILLVMIVNVKIMLAIQQQRNRINSSNGQHSQPVRINKGSFISVLLVVILCVTFLPWVTINSATSLLNVKVSLFWPSLLLLSNSFWNIFIYIFWNKLFRQELIQRMCCKVSNDNNTIDL